ncbi:MAG: DNA-processing protein DprA [Actinomycetota bacterium]
MTGPGRRPAPGTAPADEELAARLALVTLPGLGPARLAWLLAEVDAVTVVRALSDGRLPPVAGPAPAGVTRKVVQGWTAALRATPAAEVLAVNTTGGVSVMAPSHPLWPFVDDPEPPALLFSRGDLGLLTAGAMVAIVGTRRCTSVGRQVATELGAELAEAGVVVVSGLAIGVDGHAPRGALAAGGRPVAVVGTGLDVVYPAANRRLWARVATEGLLLSEAPAGARPERWRFPARNRLIAALADVVVVVESHAEGGSLLTVDEAADRGRLVMAVPGSVVSPASAGTNQLLAEGCPPVRSAADVVDALGLSSGTAPADRVGPVIPGNPTEGVGPPADDLRRLILGEAAVGPVHLDDLVASIDGSAHDGTGAGAAGGVDASMGDVAADALPVRRVLAAVHVLVAEGLVVLDGAMVSLRQQPPL